METFGTGVFRETHWLHTSVWIIWWREVHLESATGPSCKAEMAVEWGKHQPV